MGGKGPEAGRLRLPRRPHPQPRRMVRRTANGLGENHGGPLLSAQPQEQGEVRVVQGRLRAALVPFLRRHVCLYLLMQLRGQRLSLGFLFVRQLQLVTPFLCVLQPVRGG